MIDIIYTTIGPVDQDPNLENLFLNLVKKNHWNKLHLDYCVIH